VLGSKLDLALRGETLEPESYTLNPKP